MKIKQTSKPNKKWEEMDFNEKTVSVRFFPKESLEDESYLIRLEAYRFLGFTKEAMNDEDYGIQSEAKTAKNLCLF